MPDGVRKAAILVASLDTATADKMLDQFPPEQAAQIRLAMVDLGDIDPQEQRRVIDEFFRIGPLIPQQQPAGVELDDQLARKLGKPTLQTPAADSLRPVAQPFGFLHETESDELARVLSDERPQTIALVLSHLPPQRAAEILARFDAELQPDVVRRLAHLEETDHEILRDVERVLQSRLTQRLTIERRRVVGADAIQDILQASTHQARLGVLDNLAARDRDLAERLSPPPVEFDDLLGADEATLITVFQAVEPSLAMTALVGAPPSIVDRLLRQLPAAEAELVRRKLDHPGPLRLSDIEEARRVVAQIARRLIIEGRIKLPERQRTLLAA